MPSPKLLIERIKPGDWFALGQLFGGPYTLPKNGGIGVQIVILMDVVSTCILGKHIVSHQPAPLTAGDILPMLGEVFSGKGLVRGTGIPRGGVIVGRSMWEPTAALRGTVEGDSRAVFLDGHGIEFGPMAEFDKVRLKSTMLASGVPRVEFDEADVFFQ